MTTPGRHPQRVLEVDTLRFFAALMVVVFHWAFRGGATHDYMSWVYSPLLPAAKYGFLGVDLFFMISGFVILMSAQGRNLREFAVSRIVRLYPAFWICCTLTALAILTFADPHFRIEPGRYLLNMTMLTDFLPGEVKPVDGVYWSLYVEIRFYLFVALVIALGWLRHTEKLLWLWLAVATAAQLALPGSRVSGWLIASHAPLFVAGACCYLVHRDGLNKGPLQLLAATFPIALYNALTGIRGFEQRYPPYELSPLAIGLALAGFYVVMLLVATRGIPALRWRALAACGALTYPLYLLHQNLGFMIFNRLDGRVPAGLQFWSVLALMMLLSWAVHHLVERPASRPMKTLLNRAFRLAPPAGRAAAGHG